MPGKLISFRQQKFPDINFGSTKSLEPKVVRTKVVRTKILSVDLEQSTESSKLEVLIAEISIYDGNTSSV